MAHLFIGQRVFLPNLSATGTVRWIGYVDGHAKSERVGVELDKPMIDTADSATRPNQTVGRYFDCASSCGVIVKPKKVCVGIGMWEAIEKKYILRENSVVIGGHESESKSDSSNKCPTPILIGEDSAFEYFASNLFELSDLSLDACGIRDIDPYDPLARFSALRRLSLCGNLLRDMGQIVQLCCMWLTLEELDLSDNRDLEWVIRPGTLPRSDSECNISKLILDGCPSSLVNSSLLAQSFPCLTDLSLRRVNIVEVRHALPESLSSVSLTSTGIEKWSDIAHLLYACSGDIVSLDLSNNPGLGDLMSGSGDLALLHGLAGLQHLNVSNCGIARFATVCSIATHCKDLKSIRLSENPVYSLGKVRQIIICAWPALTMLNGAILRSTVREDAQKYCIGLLQRGDETLAELMPVYVKQELGQKFNLSAGDAVKASTHCLPSSVMTLTLQYNDSKLVLKIPRLCTVHDLFATVSRRISWPLKRSSLGIAAVSAMSEAEDQVDVNEQEGTLVTDFGVDDGWQLIIFVKGE